MEVQLFSLSLEYSILNCVTFAGLFHDAITSGPTSLANTKPDNWPVGPTCALSVVEL